MTERSLRRLCLAAAAVALGAATARADDNSRVSVIEENDSVVFGDSDKFYTQGLELIYLGPDVAADSAWIGPFDALGAL